MFDRITFDPAVMGGRACIRGMRMTVSLVVNLVANGMSTEDIVREYPELEVEDVRQALQSVSYTHLDVYKRQTQPVPQWYAKMAQSSPPNFRSRPAR